MCDDGRDLDGLVALVVGGTGRVGSAVCRHLASRGAVVAVHYRTAGERATGLVREISVGGRPGVALHGDLDLPGAAAELIQQTGAALGGPDILVNTAHPQFGPVPVVELAEADIAPHLGALRTHIDLCQAVVPAMAARGGGRIVLISGGLAARALPGCSVYSAVKAGLQAFQRGLALEVGRAGITVNAVAPGRVDPQDGRAPTDSHSDWERLEGNPDSRRALPSPPTAGEVAHAVGAFIGPGTGALTGQVLYLAQGEVMA